MLGIASRLILLIGTDALTRCSNLRELDLEDNRLTVVAIDLAPLQHLRELLLAGNQLEYLPNI